MDVDLPAPTLTYKLVASPTGLAISSNGIITWNPDESAGPSTNIVTTVVTDNGVPKLSSTNSFTVVVQEVNTAPVLLPQSSRQLIAGFDALTVTNRATDSDLPANSLEYQLLNPPAGASIDANGIITWTPAEAQVPSTQVFTTIVTDSNIWAVNEQRLSATNSFTVSVLVRHDGPVLPLLTNRHLNELTAVVVTNTATDCDVPVVHLKYALMSPPDGASIDKDGIITWTPSEAQGPSTNVITTVVVDDAMPPKSAANSFTIIVDEQNLPPVLPLHAGFPARQVRRIVR
jgi:hypothetical protein